MSLKENKIVQTTPGEVTIRTVVCASNYAKATGLQDCNKDSVFEPHNNPDDATKSKDGQLLVGFRVAPGVDGPESFQSKNGVARFTKSPTYAGELRRLFPPTADQQWIGYISDFGHYDPAGLRILELEPDFTLPAGADRAFKWRTVVGFRAGDPAAPNPNAAVTCSDDLVTPNTCLESPPLNKAREDLTDPVSDFAVLGGATTTAFAGTTAVLPFKLRYSDAAKLGRKSFSLSAKTQLPQSSARTAPTLSIEPDTTTEATAQVQLPTSTPAGRYAVELTAEIGTPPVARAAVGTIVVMPLPQAGSEPRTLPASGNVGFVFISPRSGVGRKVTRMTVTAVPANGTVRITCRGGGCAFKTRVIKGRRTANLAKLFRNRTLRPGTVVKLDITGPNRIAKEFTFTIRAKPRKVRVTTKCRPPAAKTTLPCAAIDG